MDNILMGLLFGAFKQGGFEMPVQCLNVKCKTAKAREEISNAFDLFRVNVSLKLTSNFVLPENKTFSIMPFLRDEERIHIKMAFHVIENEEDNSFNVYVIDENRAFDLLSFIEPFLDRIVSFSMSGVNKFMK